MKYVPTLCILTVLLTLFTFAQTSTPTPAVAPNSETENSSGTAQSTTTAKVLTEASPKSSSPDAFAREYVKKDAPAAIPQFAAAPAIDGQLNDAVWQNAAVFGDFLQTQPGDNVKPSFPTEVLMGYDAKNLYIAFRIVQDRNTVRATVARRDNIFDDDYVGMYLDTFNDKRQAYAIFLNPLGVQADGTFSEGRGEDYSVDLVMESKGVLTENGFTIEIAIPFKSLRYEAGKDKQWGLMLFRRVKSANNELNSWTPNDRSASGSLNKAGHITGLEGIETTRQLEINPSLTLSESGRRTRFTFDSDPTGRFVNDGLKGEVGLTVKYSLTPTITLDFAYNPDFAQVEADAPVTSANQRFPIFFSEKRPFFLERIDIFQSPLSVVNTRAIVDPDIAAKLTGRRGKNTFGILYASDNAPGNFSKDERTDLLLCKQQQLTDPTVVCGTERFINKNADIGVLRFKRDVGKENSLGFFATSYNFVDLHNYVGGFDGRFRLDPKTVGEFQVLGTHSRRNFYDSNLDAISYRTGNGVGYRAYLERSSRNLYMNFLAEGRTPDYRANVGFTPRTDTNYFGSYIQYRTEKDAKKAIIYKEFWNETNVRTDGLGRMQYWITNSRGTLALQKQTFIGLNLQYGAERVYEHEFGPVRSLTQQGAFFGPSAQRGANFRAFQAFIESTPNKQWYLFFFTDNTWGVMDYDFGGGPDFPRASFAAQTLGQNAPLDPGAGYQLMIEAVARYQPTTAFQTQLRYNKIKLTRNDTGLVAFDDNLFSSRSTYQFTRNTFARLRLDYSTLAHRMLPQLVIGWTPSPGTAIYAGYSDNFNVNGRNPFISFNDPLSREQGLHSNGRTFFIKMSYLFKKSF
ncbi:MAG TPA: sugar-binding protein [Pyrinomonadaceae bacterium]|jgi:hypothetical protein|nr:sugar-binding protein [Pyrinomonadaceae bacterium]